MRNADAKHLLFVVNVPSFFVSHRLPVGVEASLRGWRVDLLFGREKRYTRGGVQYGWTPRSGAHYTQAEPMLWGAAALAAALNRPGLLGPEERRRFLGYLAQTHAILRTYEPTSPAGGWHVLPHPKRPEITPDQGLLLCP